VESETIECMFGSILEGLKLILDVWKQF